jgi:protein tyrosine/serine phosphatase
LAVLVIVAAIGLYKARHYVLLDNFGVVEEGAVYRSGQLQPYQLERVIREHGLKTVINTREAEAPAALMAAEEEVCRQLGVEHVRLPMPGDGRGGFAQYDQALAILNDPDRLPALVHCARGTHRTGALIAAYRVRVQGRDPAEALAEMEQYRFDPADHPLVPHLAEYLGEE